MPRVAKELSALEVKRLQHPQIGGKVTFSVGGVSGLLLQISPSGSRSWLLRTTVGHKRREIGLGGYPEVSLAEARVRAQNVKEKIYSGVDPVEERRAMREKLAIAQARTLTFAEAVERCVAARSDGFRNDKHRKQWRSTLNNYAVPVIGAMSVDRIQVQDILRVLEPIWQSKTETAKRLRGRIEAVLTWATVAGHRVGDNPARWSGNLKELLPNPEKVANKQHHPAIRLEDMPRWIGALRSLEGVGSRALEFLAITAARSGEVRGAVWDEIDFNKGIWIVKKDRMKMYREHRVPLPEPAFVLLKALPRSADNPLIFPAPRGGQLSDMTLSATMKRLHLSDLKSGYSGFFDPQNKRAAVPHGLRSTFRDWVAEKTNYPNEMAEIALAHKISNAVEASYRRGDMIERRREMMKDWASFLSSDVR
ncbi:integrase arm-type DNA-binding domain-containing protein [Halocynthiibacter sp. C4]|uniref:tyrosine-type recombinase/integrase n=1 Tax=Halocynthiibacter sp. C4 TaxID=2992758 RepID=UPI00237B3219|nr:integrase arm-type DNA-binding domain-containing protein [Halocynthiibacter sp. C4]MDE0588574.1 integrase arm-type DNA-binding domain-containing protein [Halocynthiibacter sp. C4]